MPEPIRALTICQPYAHLIVTPQAELPRSPVGLPPEQKRVENRTWYTAYRGPLAIHAGQSRKWLELAEDEDGNELEVDIYGLRPGELVYGAVVGLVDLVDCIHLEWRPKISSASGFPQDVLEKYPWLEKHLHAEGPWCWILANARRLKTPVPASGKQQLWAWYPPVPLADLEFADE